MSKCFFCVRRTVRVSDVAIYCKKCNISFWYKDRFYNSLNKNDIQSAMYSIQNFSLMWVDNKYNVIIDNRLYNVDVGDLYSDKFNKYKNYKDLNIFS